MRDDEKLESYLRENAPVAPRGPEGELALLMRRLAGAPADAKPRSFLPSCISPFALRGAVAAGIAVVVATSWLWNASPVAINSPVATNSPFGESDVAEFAADVFNESTEIDLTIAGRDFEGVAY